MAPKHLGRKRRLLLLAAGLLGYAALLDISPAQRRGPLRPGSRARPPAAVAEPERLTLTGKLKELEGNLLTIESEEHGPLPIWLKTATDYLLEDRIVVRETLNVGDDITVEARKEPSGSLIAVKVTVHLTSLWKGRGDRRTVMRSPALEGPLDQDDPGRPRLRRHPDSASPGSGSRVAIPLIERAREQVFAYTERLPNFICTERIARMERDRFSGWRTLDFVEADLVYEDGRESYRNIKINGKPVGKDMKHIEGASSTGEFASTLLSIFIPDSQTEFRFAETSRIIGRPAAVYDFQIDKEYSQWNVGAGNKTIKPAYRGSVWIEEETARVLRIEMEAFDLPPDFDLDTVELDVDYGNVLIGDSEYFLPVESENLACWRGTNQCARNQIEFRNYRKFTAESTIVTTDSTIDYEDQPAEADQPSP